MSSVSDLSCQAIDCFLHTFYNLHIGYLFFAYFQIIIIFAYFCICKIICKKYAKNIQKYPKYAKTTHILQKVSRCMQDICKIYARYMQDICKFHCKIYRDTQYAKIMPPISKICTGDLADGAWSLSHVIAKLCCHYDGLGNARLTFD